VTEFFNLNFHKLDTFPAATGWEYNLDMTLDMKIVLTWKSLSFPVHAMQIYGSGGTAPPTTTLGWGERSASRCGWFTPRGDSPSYSLIRKMVGPHNWSWWCAEKQNLLPLPGIEPQFLICPANSPVTLLTTLSRLPTLMDIGEVCVMKQNDVTCFWYGPVADICEHDYGACIP